MVSAADPLLCPYMSAFACFSPLKESTNESKLIHVTFTTRRKMCPSPPPPRVRLNNVHLPREDYVKYLRLHLDRKLTWHKHIFA
jgi:hypothetical protein